MRLAAALIVLAAAPATACPRAALDPITRSVEVMPLVGIGWTGAKSTWGQTDRFEGKAVSTRLELSAAWERSPFSYRGYDSTGLRWMLGSFTIAPELSIVLDGSHTTAYAGVRLGTLSPWYPSVPSAAPILRGWYTPRIGVRDGRGLAAGLQRVEQLQLGRTFGLVLALTGDVWSESPPVAARGTTKPLPPPSTVMVELSVSVGITARL
jgi:hypothetical protein